MWPWLLAAAAGGYLLGSNNKGSSPEAPERMPYEEALKQAEEAMRPGYEKGRERVLGDIDTSLVSRGFYGQAPGDAFTARTMADMESDFQGQLAASASNLQNQQFMQDYQLYQTDLQYANQMDPFWTSLGGILGSFLSGPGGDSFFNWLIN